MMNGSGQPPAYDGSAIVSIKLPLGQWQQVMQVLIDTPLPWKLVNPLVVAMDRQLQEAVAQMQPVDIGRQEGVLPSA